MNRYEQDILLCLHTHTTLTQRDLATLTSMSLGKVNASIQSLQQEDYINANLTLTTKGKNLIKQGKTKNAIILAAGSGMRMVPINSLTPKGLLEVHEEPLIERLIKQLQEANVTNIVIVVGFMKEAFEYLIDTYNVRLIVNPHYNDRNNLYSLSLASMLEGNTYITPSDVYCKENPFKANELYSWYMINDTLTVKSPVKMNSKFELKFIKNDEEGNRMIGISHLTGNDFERLMTTINEYKQLPQYNHCFFEEAFNTKTGMWIQGKLVKSDDVIEIDTYEQLLEIDHTSKQLDNTAINIIKETFQVDANAIKNLSLLKKGMTNRSFSFQVNNQTYIMRIPGEGTDQLINRKEEASVYKTIKPYQISDPIVYMNEDNGYKITKYINNAHNCDPTNIEEVTKCMQLLKKFHALDLKVEHSFDFYKLIDFYESLWNNTPSAYKDYQQTKENVLSLRPYIEANIDHLQLCHLDAVADNFLFAKDEQGNTTLNLIDWEYAAMQDKDADIANFIIYSLLDKQQADEIIDIYYDNQCPPAIRKKIYCYIASFGLLWSNWCEYKRNLGVEFGEYSLAQYRYAKDFYKYATEH